MAAPETEETASDPLAQVRHDLKTPINQIIGYSEMLAEDAEDEGVLADLSKITTAAKTLLDLIDKELRPGKLTLQTAAPSPAQAAPASGLGLWPPPRRRYPRPSLPRAA
jgi:sigma-B regulation protein RsbU (phosphoserine phosphatase)